MLKRPGQPRGPQYGPGRKLFPSKPGLLQTNVVVAAPIWVTLAVNKTKKVQRAIRIKTQFVKPVRATAVVIIIHKKPPLVVSLTEFLRKKSVAKVRITEVFGKPTTKPIIRPLVIVEFSAQDKIRKRRITGKIKLGGVKGRPTRPVKVKGPIVLIFATKERVRKYRITGSAKLKKVFGRPTTKSIIRPLLIVDFATQEKIKKKRIISKIILGKSPKVVTIITVRPQKLRILLQKTPKKPKTFTKLGKVYGKPTTKPPIQALSVIDFSIKESLKKKRISTKSILSKPTKFVTIIVTVRPKPIKILLQKIPKKPLTRFKLGKVFGKPTKAPKPQKLKIISNSGNIKLLRARHKTVTVLRKAGGGNNPFIWNEYGSPFLFTAANWTAPNSFFEVYLRAITGTLYARVLDKTTGLPVPGSDLNTSSNVFIRLRSPEIILEDGHEYKLQLGKFANDSAEAFEGEIIIM